MLDRLQKSPEVIKATDQMAAVVGDFFRDEAIPRELVQFAICEAMRVLRAERWSPSQVLAYCRKVSDTEAARERSSMPERKKWLDDHLAAWLLTCCDAR